MSEDSAKKDKPVKMKRPQQVFTLLVEVGRAENDGLPEGATGAALMCYALGAEVLSLVCDVTDAAACAASLSAVEQHFGRIDALATMRASGRTPFRKPSTARRSGSGKPSPRHGGRSSRRTSTAPSTWPAPSRQMGKIMNICASDVTMVRRGYAP